MQCRGAPLTRSESAGARIAQAKAQGDGIWTAILYSQLRSAGHANNANAAINVATAEAASATPLIRSTISAAVAHGLMKHWTPRQELARSQSQPRQPGPVPPDRVPALRAIC